MAASLASTLEAAPAPWTAPASPSAVPAAPAAIAAPNRRPASARAALSHAQAGNGQFTHGHFGSEGLKPPEAWESAYLAGKRMFDKRAKGAQPGSAISRFAGTEAASAVSAIAACSFGVMPAKQAAATPGWEIGPGGRFQWEARKPLPRTSMTSASPRAPRPAAPYRPVASPSTRKTPVHRAPPSFGAAHRPPPAAGLLAHAEPVPTPPAQKAAPSALSFAPEGAPSADMSDVWVEQIRPAITWLYNFVDMVVSDGAGASAASSAASADLLLAEHRLAMHDVCQHVGGLLRVSGDGLALCLWRALVALLTHFGQRAEPLMAKLRRLQRDRLTLDALAERQAADLSSWARTQERLESEVERLQTELTHERRRGALAVAPAAAAGVAASSTSKGSSEQASEMIALRAELKAARLEKAKLKTDLMIERSRHAIPERMDEDEGAPSTAGHAGISLRAELEARRRLSASAAMRNSQGVSLFTMHLEVERLEKALRDEGLRRQELEGLRAAFAAKFTPAFVQNLERELAMQDLGLSVEDAPIS